MSKIDEIDVKIVGLLMDDGRMAVSEIARQVGEISERAVRYRINRLIEDGVIKVGAIVNPRTLGYNVVADVFLEVETGYIEDVARQVSQYECVSYVACSIGESDVSVQVVGRDNAEIYAFVTDVIGRMPKVRRTHVSLVPLKLKDVYQWRIPESVCVQ